MLFTIYYSKMISNLPEYILNHIFYDSHIIKKEKTFKSFEDIISSMALSWLMYLYH